MPPAASVPRRQRLLPQQVLGDDGAGLVEIEVVRLDHRRRLGQDRVDVLRQLQAFELIGAGDAHALVDQFEEIDDLERPVDMTGILDALAGLCVPVVIDYRWRPTGAHIDDELVIETAVNGHADAVATFNMRDMREAGAQFGFQTRRPGPLVQRIRG